MSIDHLFLLVAYGLLSFITFCVYGMDKWAAKRQKSRVRESRLHLLSLVGGWPGALLGQRVFRHKTKKVRFRVVFWLTLLVNVTLVSLIFFLNGWG
ncbi:DUF1294 domain-containing protein [Marinomonas transparens]|uniref:DUF1294 domain-containing protein n=1 Tax=Marinomonas transparens TaxID=2795388 RepID=A0A934JN61_9GAMM|nr:DUF1294 domain-containing protein [Marinomonas transparens]MBJ7539310.1 DUF1294 domain-containing protein [Marinomonas transparens]